MEVHPDGAVGALVDDGVVEVDFTRVFLIAHFFRPFRPLVHVFFGFLPKQCRVMALQSPYFAPQKDKSYQHPPNSDRF